jgi:aminomethyltransferase
VANVRATVSRTGYTGEDGFEIFVPPQSADRVWQAILQSGQTIPCGLGARDTLRLEAGMNLYGQDMDRSVTPLECGLAWTVALEGPRDFVGKAALARRAPAHKMLGLVLEGRGGVLRSHQGVGGAHGEGVITSGSFSPTLNASIALARLPAPSEPGETVQVSVRDRQLAARTVRPPFVRRGKILV